MARKPDIPSIDRRSLLAVGAGSIAAAMMGPAPSKAMSTVLTHTTVAHWCFDNTYMQEPLLREAF
jgi:hypothetical protein